MIYQKISLIKSLIIDFLIYICSINNNKIKLIKMLQQKIKNLLTEFHDENLNIENLEKELLKLNPHAEGSMESGFYVDWIQTNIEDYKDGEVSCLSLTSSNSICNS